jgi:hypothetical protein
MMPLAAPFAMAGAFAVGLGVRGRLQRHFPRLFRTQLAVGVGLLGFLAGWSFHVSVGNVVALAVLLTAQVGSVGLAAWLFRAHDDGPLLAFAMYGNPGFWTLPVAAATLGPGAAVFIAVYDTLTQPRVALAVRMLRRRASIPQSLRSGAVDYAPTAAATTGVAVGRLVPAPAGMASAVAVLGVGSAVVGAHVLGIAWPRTWLGRHELRLTFRVLALHYSVVPGVLASAWLAGMELPGAVWLLAFGPLPISLVSFARLYGYSLRFAATAVALSAVSAAALVPAALAVAAWASG